MATESLLAAANYRTRALIILPACLFLAIAVLDGLPYYERGSSPNVVSEWLGVLSPLAAVIIATVVMNLIAARARRQRVQLVRAYEELRLSVASGLVGDELLRVSRADGVDAASAALAVVEAVDAGITFYSPTGVVLLTNDTARDLRVAGDPERGSAPAVLMQDRITRVEPGQLPLALAMNGQLVTRRAYWLETASGEQAVMVTSHFVRRASGEVIGIVVASHDVTMLAEAIESRDAFLTTVSHELLTPMTSVIGYLEVIEDLIDVDGVGIGSEFSIVQRNATRLNSLIRDLLTSAAHGAVLERRPIDLAHLGAIALDSVRARAATAEVSLSDLRRHIVIAEVDANRIGYVLDKLLSNAVLFNQPGGTVSLAVEKTDREAVIRVSDTGRGLTTDDALHMFDRFFRSSDARHDKVTGVGLGLSTAKLITNAHHGTISAQSVLGEGTTVEVRLPLVVA